MRFEPKRHLIKVQGGRNYLPVSARLIWFRQEHPDWGIETEPVTIDCDKQYAIFRARIYNAEGRLMATGTKREDIKGFPDYLEKAETGSVGRALALCGFGTQFAPELDEVDVREAAAGNGRFHDSPLPSPRSVRPGGRTSDRAFGPPASRPDPDHGPEAAYHHPAAIQGSDLRPHGPTGQEAAPEAVGGSCAHCPRSLTKSQQELSMRNFGVPLCPACQKAQKNGAAA